MNPTARDLEMARASIRDSYRFGDNPFLIERIAAVAAAARAEGHAAGHAERQAELIADQRRPWDGADEDAHCPTCGQGLDAREKGREEGRRERDAELEQIFSGLLVTGLTAEAASHEGPSPVDSVLDLDAGEMPGDVWRTRRSTP